MTERFSASVAAKQMACPASANLELAIPGYVAPVEDRTADNAANKGTAMHEILEKAGEYTAKEMLGIAQAMQYVAELRTQRRFKMLREHSFTADWLQSKPKTTVDVALYTQDQLEIVDYKFGRIPVEVQNNSQFLYYAVTAAHLAPKAKGVTVHVVQPFANNIDSWFADTNVLQQFMADALAAEAKILAGDTTFGPSDNCKFCPANPHSRGAKGTKPCPAMMQLLYPPLLDEDEVLSL